MSNLDQLKPVAVGVALVAACAAMVWNSPASASAPEAFAMKSLGAVSSRLLEPTAHGGKHKPKADSQKRSAPKAQN
jgi:hypothetical protein